MKSKHHLYQRNTNSIFRAIFGLEKQCNRMKKTTLLALFIIVVTVPRLFAQMDTLKRKDPNGWEFIQIRKGGVTTLEGHLNKGIQQGVWTSYWASNYPQQIITYL